MEISQHEFDGNVTVHSYHDCDSYCDHSDDISITNGDMVMLINFYKWIKDNDIQNDFINPNGKNR